jgi:peptide/nickel transport system ATP-binding protein
MAAVPVTPLLQIDDLRVSYGGALGDLTAVDGVSLTVEPGEVVAVVGESGSGKSTLAMAVLGLLPGTGRIDGGHVVLNGDTDLGALSERALRSVRGRRIGLIPQDPTVSLNPVTRVGDQVAEVLRVHGLADRRTARIEAVALLERAGLDDAAVRAGQYPHELSGGMRQRVLIAIAIAANPKLIIADEPTSALDATVQRRILDHLDDLTRTSGTAVLLITHDLGVAADRADRVVVMSGGRIVEQGPVRQILEDPQADYTRRLVTSAPGLRPIPARPALVGGRSLVEVHELVKEYRLPGRKVLRAVDGVSFGIGRGETLGLVGESGSGKSTIARLLLRLTDPTSGRVVLDGADVTAVRGRAARELRRRAQLVYQNPYSSLDPRFSIEDVVTEPLRAFSAGTRAEQRARAAELLDRVALPVSALQRRPAELSGGQRQRVAIARALALAPDLVVCDEPVSALDVSVQAQVLDLLRELQDDQGLAYLFISHDLAVVRAVAHRVGVLQHGRLVELRPTEELYAAPTHPYTVELLAAVAGQGSIRIREAAS